MAIAKADAQTQLTNIYTQDHQFRIRLKSTTGGIAMFETSDLDEVIKFCMTQCTHYIYY